MTLLSKVESRAGILTKLVAHRGDQETFVENTLEAFQQASDAGALFVECDIQFTKDLIPIVFHDENLKRLYLMDFAISGLHGFDINALGTLYQIPKLSELLVWLEQHPKITLFLEVKPDILQRLSADEVADLLFEIVVASLNNQLVIISESVQTLEACAAKFSCSMGWVAEGDDVPSRALEQHMDYIFMSADDVANIPDWKQKGIKVGVYTINDAARAFDILEMGADLIETNYFSRMLRDMEGGDAQNRL